MNNDYSPWIDSGQPATLMDSDYSPWLDSGRPATFWGIPVLVYLVLHIWVIWPSLPMLMFCIALLIFYKVLAIFGYTLTVLLQRLLHRMRGNIITGRPWWYRKFFE